MSEQRMMNKEVRGLWGLIFLVFALGGLGCGGCDGRARQEGEKGNLQFSYRAADLDRRFDRPLAVGSGMLIELEPVGKRSLDRIVGVRAEPAGIFEASVDQGDSRSIIISGQQAGSAKLIVDVQGGGESYSDQTTLKVDRPTQVAMRHMCTDEINAGYLVGDPIQLEWKRYNSKGEVLVGSARSTADPARGCQAEISPGELQQSARCDEAGLEMDLIYQPGPVRVRLAQGIQRYSNSPSELGVQVVSPELLDFEPLYEDLRVDVSRRIELRPITYGQEWPVCTDLWMRVYIDTPYNCSGPNGEDEFDVEPADENSFLLRGREPGICEFAVVVYGDEPMEFLFDAYVDY